ncbi:MULTISPECIES: hypothetical protein [unclassified Streptomyces]|uniref:hypothetical protein n=1 Tax=unclassified Streptomyces TaxID=2593676 RepID=UPI002E81EE41|nr:hypothetical protein [Streptomyces sp. NBC_00503]WUD81996.1 hypothetical protein OG490_16400 [Streptomyces sp. NBC_00503]
MRMRSALTASVLAAGILLGGASVALADDGGALVQSTGSRGGARSESSSFAGVPAHFGPIWGSTGSKEKSWDRDTFQGVFFGH